MQYNVFWIILTFLITLAVIAIVLLVQVIRSRQSEESGFSSCGNWHVELWNICYGYPVDLRFSNTCVVGRTLLYEYMAARRMPELDTTVSREHCMFYEQDGLLFVWNMSAVNPAVLNGYRLNQPVQVLPGDRLELGNSAFLITRVENV